MALIKSKTLSNGTSGNYWKIIECYVDRKSLIAFWKIALYMDRNTSISGGDHMRLIKTYTSSITREQSMGNLVEIGYEIIKEKSSNTISVDINGTPLENPRPFDPDLDGATDS